MVQSHVRLRVTKESIVMLAKKIVKGYATVLIRLGLEMSPFYRSCLSHYLGCGLTMFGGLKSSSGSLLVWFT